MRLSQPSNVDAAKLYSEGLAKLQAFDALAARNLLNKAVAAAPGNAMSHSALAVAWRALGYNNEAKAEAKKAFDLSSNLDREQRLQIEARYDEVSRTGERRSRSTAPSSNSSPTTWTTDWPSQTLRSMRARGKMRL